MELSPSPNAKALSGTRRQGLARRLAAAVAGLMVTLASHAQSFEVFEPAGISTTGSDFTTVEGLSADGSAIIGNTSVPGVGPAELAPFIWRADTGLFVITNLHSGAPVQAVGVANGGNRAALKSTAPLPMGQWATLLWTRTNGLQSTGFLTTGPAEPRAMSSNGKVIVGRTKSLNAPAFNQWEAFRWTAELGMVGLGDILGDPDVDRFTSEAVGVSAEGRIVLGRVRYGGVPGIPEAGAYYATARWVDGGLPQMLPKPPLAEDEDGYFPDAISANGTQVVGHYWYGGDHIPGGGFEPQIDRAYLWSESLGFTILYEAVGHALVPTGVSDDGLVVVGYRTTSSEPAAIWTPDRGMRPLRDALTELGIDPGGFTLGGVAGISADGRIIVGTGTDIRGKRRGYRAVLWELPPRKIIVNSVADRPMVSGGNCCDTGEKLANGDIECTLRAAIEAVNAGCGDRIEFAVPGVAIPKVTPQTPLPAIHSRVDIDGTTQSGGQVEISGTESTGICLDLQGGGSRVRGLVINNFTGADGVGIRLLGGGRNVIIGNYLGTDVRGNARAFNLRNLVITNSSYNEIGTTRPGEGNVIADAVEIAGTASTGNLIVANRIGIGADGTSAIGRNVGINILGGRDTRIGGGSGEGNYIAGISEFAVFVNDCQDTLVEGNYVGLDVRGIGALGGEVGIIGVSTSDSALANLIIRSNRVAGVRAGIVILGNKTTGTRVTDNVVGTRFDGSGALPAGVDADHARFGIRVDGSPNVQVLRNIVSGADMNLLIAGKPQMTYTPCQDNDGDGLCDNSSELVFHSPEDPGESDGAHSDVGGVIVGANTLGLNEGLRVPDGAQQRFGVAVYRSARDLQIRNNVVAGHSECDIWLSDGTRLQLMQNRIGTSDGSNRNSQVGVLVEKTSGVTIAPSGTFLGNTISRQKKAAILVRDGATNLLIRQNQIGTGPGGAVAWPNGSGIHASGPNITGLRLEDNLINASATNAVLLELSATAVLQGNRIGVSSAGLGLSNKLGVVVRNTPVELRDNTIAYNGVGITIIGSQPALIQGGPLYENGSGDSAEAILYLDQSNPVPSVFILSKLTTPGGKIALSFTGVAPSAAGGDVEIEIYGNRAGERQARTPLGRRMVRPNDRFSFALEGEPGSAFDTLPEFSATATQNGRTSVLTPVKRVKVEARPIVTGTTSTDISLQWPATVPFTLERGNGPAGPWVPVLVVPMVVDGIATVTLPLDGESQYFRLVLDP